MKNRSLRSRSRALALLTAVGTAMLVTLGGVGLANAAVPTGDPTASDCALASKLYGLCYLMNEPASTAPKTPMLDSSPNHLNSIKIMPGITRDGSSYHFAGTGSVILPNKPPAQVGTRNFIITVQLHLDPLPPCAADSCSQNFFQKGGYNIDPTKGQWKLEMSGTHVHCRIFGDGGEASVWYFGIGNQLASNTPSYWHTLSCSRVGTTIKLTVDGKTKTKTFTTGNVVNSRNVLIGGKGQGCGTDCDYTRGYINYATLQYLP